MIFKNFADQDWIRFNFWGSGLDSNWKISQSANLCCTTVSVEHTVYQDSSVIKHTCNITVEKNNWIAIAL